MAMLAEPRRKQKIINLRAKNSAWSNDSTKFGQRMLEKMGWSSGKGLGAKENGIVEHVVARYKNDDKGLGFEDRNDQWTKHEDDFNTLLANLSSGDKGDEKQLSGVSLEVKSKKSKARIHYHKFTRGKDLSRYSEKDLANIFGKKSLKQSKEAKQDVIDAETEDVKATEQIFTEKGSMEDYFKNKLASMKFRNKTVADTVDNEDVEDKGYGFLGFAGTASNEESEATHQYIGFQPFTSSQNSITDDVIENEETKNVTHEDESDRKRKKKKKSDTKVFETDDLPAVNEEIPNDDLTEIAHNERKSKKSKRKKAVPVPEESSEQSSKKKKSKKILEENTVEAEEEVTVLEKSPEESSKKKKSKKRLENIAEAQEEPLSDHMEPPKKKKKKKKDNDL